MVAPSLYRQTLRRLCAALAPIVVDVPSSDDGRGDGDRDVIVIGYGFAGIAVVARSNPLDRATERHYRGRIVQRSGATRPSVSLAVRPRA